MRRLALAAAFVAAGLVATIAGAQADPSALPDAAPAATSSPAATTTSTSTTAPVAPMPAAAAPAGPPPPPMSGLLPAFDPCGGPKEMINKVGPLPCIVVAGEATITASYTSVNAAGNAQINGPIGPEVNLPLFAHLFTYPGSSVVVGLTKNTQFQYSVPSFAQVNGPGGTLVAGATNMAFDVKQRVFFSPTKFTQVSVDLGYIPPTGSEGLSGVTPSYHGILLFAQPLSPNWTFGGTWSFKNASTASSTDEPSGRGWSDPFLLYAAWSPSRAPFVIIPVVYHQFNPNETAVALGAELLLSRHLLLIANYGGLDTVGQGTGPAAGLLNYNVNTYPRALLFSLTYLIGKSDLPGPPPPP